MSKDDELFHLVHVYLREEIFETNTEYQYTESLTTIFIHFLGNILFRGFDTIYPRCIDFISDNGRTIKIDKGNVKKP